MAASDGPTQLDQSYQKLVKIIETLQIGFPNLSKFIIYAEQCIKVLRTLPNSYEEQNEFLDICETLTGWAGGILRIAEVTAAHPRELFTAEDEHDIQACLEKLSGIRKWCNLGTAANQTPLSANDRMQLVEQLCDKDSTLKLNDSKVYRLKAFHSKRTMVEIVPSPENTSERDTKSICLIGEDALVEGVVNLIVNFIYGIDYEDDYRLEAPYRFCERAYRIKLQWQKLFRYPFNVHLIVGTVENIRRYSPGNWKFFQKYLIVDEASNLNETSTREQIETMKRSLNHISPGAESVCRLVVHKNLNKFIKSESMMKEAGKVSGQVLDLFDPDSIYEKSIEAREKWMKSHRTLKTLFDDLQSHVDIPAYFEYDEEIFYEILDFKRKFTSKEKYFSNRQRLLKMILLVIRQCRDCARKSESEKVRHERRRYHSHINFSRLSICERVDRGTFNQLVVHGTFNELEEKEKKKQNRDENYLELLKNCREGCLKYGPVEIVRNTSLIEPTQYERDLLKQQQKSVGEVSDTQPQFSPQPEPDFKPSVGKGSSQKQSKDASIPKSSSELSSEEQKQWEQLCSSY